MRHAAFLQVMHFGKMRSSSPFADYEKLYSESISDIEGFWAREAREHLHWFTPFNKTLEWNAPYAKWFLGGTTNVSYNCLDAHIQAGNGERVAFFWEGERAIAAF